MIEGEYKEKVLTRDEFGEALERIDEKKLEIEDQNDRYGQLKHVGNRALRYVVKRGINDEQVDSFMELLSTATSIPYDAVGYEHQRLNRELKEVSSRIDIMDENLNADLELSKRLTTRRQDELIDAYQTEQDRFRHDVRNTLEHRSSEVTELYEKAGEAWPIPQAIPPEDRIMLYGLIEEDSNSETLQIEDIIPVTPEEHLRNAQIAERAKRTVGNPQLSSMVMFYLTERQTETVTVEDLIRYCYALDADDANHYRSRITTTLGPKVAGLKKQEELNAEGQALQYGWRYAYEIMPDDRRVTRRRTRIYRVVDIQQSALEEDRGKVNGLSIVDEWSAIETSDLTQSLTEGTDTGEIDIIPSIDIEQQQTWQEKLGADINGAITQMQEAFLFSEDDDEFKGGMIRSVTASARIGTKTSYELLVAAGVMRRDQVKWDIMNRRQIAISYVLNAHPEVSGERGKKQQKEALAIIDSAIEQRLAEDNPA